MFSIFGSYGILLLSFIYAILFIYETRYTNGVIGYGIFSAISFVFLVSGGILIIKPLTVFSKGYVISQEKDKKIKHLIDYGSCTLFIFLSLIGTIINIIAICLHAQSGFTVGLSDIKILILGFVPLLGSILSVYSSYFSRKGKIIGVIIAFFSSWGNAVYVFGFFLLVYYNTPLRGAVMSNVWIYFLVLIFTQVNGLRILGSSEIYITPSARTESIS